MPFEPKKTRNKVESAYKSIYLKQTVIDQLDQLATKHNTSFNNIVATMIEQCLEDIRKEEEEAEEENKKEEG